MVTPLVLASLLTLGGSGAPARCEAPLRSPEDASLRAMYETGVDYRSFLESAKRRRELWVSNTERSQVPEDLLSRARAVGGRWYLLAVAVDGCSDSVNTIPYIAKLVELVEGLEMRIVDSTVGGRLMKEHPTRDDRAATPTVLLLDGDWDEMGCFIERPDPLQTWYQENKGTLDGDALFERKMLWYDEDEGVSTVAEIVAILEAAAARKPICRG